MKKLMLLVSWLAAGTVVATAGTPAQRILPWTPADAAKGPWAGVVSLPGRELALRIENTNTTPLQADLVSIDNPGITRDRYRLTGRVRYEGVEGDAFLEMWSHFPPAESGGAESRYFSRTLSETGPMGKLRGSSDWRDFELPFNAQGAPTKPSKLSVTLHLPGRGTVWIGSLTLAEIDASPGAGAAEGGAWWSTREGNLFGGIAGAVFGSLAGVLGFLAERGKARRFVMTTLAAMIAAGIVATIIGIVALASGQPRPVTFPLLLTGVLLVTIIPINLNGIRRQYDRRELRRIEALDATG